MHKFGAKMQF